MTKIINSLVAKGIEGCTTYIEPFCGGANSLSAIDFNKKLTCDTNQYVIAFWNDVKNGNFTEDMWTFVKYLAKEQYYDVKEDYKNKTGRYKDSIIGYVGCACSYGGSWWNGYANYNPNKNENHIYEAYSGTVKQINGFKQINNTDFICCDYKSIMDHVKGKAFIYCDPPYGNTKGYKINFDNEEFWNWCRKTANDGHILMISEYNAPSDFIPIYQKKMQDGMSSNNGEKNEKIFVLKTQFEKFDTVFDEKQIIKK